MAERKEKKKIIVQSTKFLDSGSQIIMTREMDEDEFKKEQEEKAKQKTALTRAFELLVQRNGGSDQEPLPSEWKCPTDKQELIDSFKSVEPLIFGNAEALRKLYPLLKKNLYCLIPTGKPPQTVSQSDLKHFQESAREAVPFGGRIGTRLAECTVPNLWLGDALRTQCLTRQSLISQILHKLGMQTMGSSVDACWIRAVAHFNGCMKTLWEVLTFCCNEDGTLKPEFVKHVDEVDEEGNTIRKKKKKKGKKKKKDEDEEDEEEEEEEEEEKPKPKNKRKRKKDDDEEEWVPEKNKDKEEDEEVENESSPKKKRTPKKAREKEPESTPPTQPTDGVMLASSSGNPSVNYDDAASVLVD